MSDTTYFVSDDGEFVPFEAAVWRSLASIDARLATIASLLEQSIANQETQMSDLSGLQAEVQQNGDVIASAVTLINGLAQQLRDAANDPAAIQALVDQLDTQSNDLAAAVAANTPADTGGGSTDTGGGTDTGTGDPGTA